MLSNRGSNPALCSHLSKTQVDQFDKNSETLKIQNAEGCKNSDRNYKPFKSGRWIDGMMGVLIYNKRPEAYLEQW